jgi:hypothetical protein
MLLQGRARLWLLGTVLASCGVSAIALSCLPDLQPEVLQTPPQESVCGDGIIDPEAGEECDPGRNGSVPGCSSTCKIVCDAGALLSYRDPTTNHCYFQLSAEAGPFEAGSGCKAHGAHMVTLGSGSEAQRLQISSFSNTSGLPHEFWLGVHAQRVGDGGVVLYDASGTDAGAIAYVPAIDEPGFMPTGGCLGCYAPGKIIPPNDPTRECVTWLLTTPGRWNTVNCDGDAAFPVMCEREPPGSRARSCSGFPCFTIQADLAASQSRTYVWVPGVAQSADEAERTCAALPVDGGAKLLVIFGDQNNFEQREEIFYELMNLPRVPDASAPSDFWVGLSRAVTDGGPVGWVWSNFEQGTNQWGNRQPTPLRPETPARAYAQQTATSYGSPGRYFDTQLLHVQALLPDGGTPPDGRHGVLCEYQ